LYKSSTRWICSFKCCTNARFRSNNPGSEEAREKLYVRGLFLDDNERDYDTQALEALEKCVKLLKDRYRTSVTNLQDQYVKADLKLDTPQFQERLNVLGLTDLQKRIDILEKRINIIRKTIDSTNIPSVQKLNPELTCFVLDPPREFPSKTSLKIFLEEHPDIKKAHNNWLKQNQVSAITND